MDMSIAAAREFLHVPPVATRDELHEAMNGRFKEAVLQDRVELARRACDAFAIVMVDEGIMEQYRADQFLAEMSTRITALTARMDQMHAEDAEIQACMAAADIAVAKAKADVAKAQAVLDRLDAQRYAAARWIAKWRIRRRKFIQRIMSIFK